MRILILLLVPFLAFGQINVDKLDAYFTKAQKDWGIPGMAVGVIKDGEIVLAKGYGVLEDGKETPVDGNSLFAIASNTKAFISASLAILVDEGKLNWDDPVKKYLPDFSLYDDDYVSNHATIRDLLCHRVGLGTFSGDVIWYKSSLPASEVVKKAGAVPQAYDFRSGYGYTNLMFITAGEVIAAVSGKSWSEFAAERFFQPLGMERTVTTVTKLPQMKNVATPHKPKDGENLPIEWANWDNMGAAGGIISSVNDMLQWIQLQIEGGSVDGKQYFSRDRQIDFWTTHNNYRISDNARENYPSRHFNGYALGWGVFDYGGKFVASHSGGYDGMYSRVAIMPEEKLGFVVLTNSMKGISNPLMYYTFDRFLGLDQKDWSASGLRSQQRSEAAHSGRIENYFNARKKNTTPSLSLDEYVGTYTCSMYGDIIIKMENGALTVDFSHAPNLKASLSHWHFDTFQLNWEEEHAWFDFGTLQFVLDNNAKPIKLMFDVPNYDIFFDEIQAVKKD